MTSKKEKKNLIYHAFVGVVTNKSPSFKYLKSFRLCWCCHQLIPNKYNKSPSFYYPKLLYSISGINHMDKINFDYHPQFLTATILNWNNLLSDDIYKDIIIESLLFLKNEKSVVIYGFVIMPNHIHLLWQIQDGYKQDKVQMRFLKYTAQQLKFKLIDTNDKRLKYFEVNLKDRKYQFWQRNALSIDLWTPNVFMQKLDYIHNNPLQEKWQLSEMPEDYIYSSASFYETGIDKFGLLTHYAD